jgi:hypothetical protein
MALHQGRGRDYTRKNKRTHSLHTDPELPNES